MNQKSILRIIKFFGGLEILGGISCFLGAIALYNMQTAIINDDVLTNYQLNRLTIYIWLSCAISFMLAFGLFNLHEWSRKLLLAFAAFGLFNMAVRVFPNISSFITPYLPSIKNISLESIKTFIFATLDCFIIYFFTRPKVKVQFNSAQPPSLIP